MTLKFYSKSEKGWVMDSIFEAMTFPGGEPHIKVKSAIDPSKFQYQIADLRGANSHDLMTLAMWADLCMSRGERRVLILPYLPGARADRGQPFGAWVYTDFITKLVSPNQTITLDPHSGVMPRLIQTSVDYNNLTVFPVERIIRDRLGDKGDYKRHPYVGVIAPDKGAVDRAQRAANVLGVPLYQAEKTRDFESGKLTGFTCEELPEAGKLLLVDDICDGGGTFIGLAQATGLTHDRLDLWVTHGIFSKGISELTYHFDHIYTTDSWGTEEDSEHLTVIPVLSYLTGEINV